MSQDMYKSPSTRGVFREVPHEFIAPRQASNMPKSAIQVPPTSTAQNLRKMCRLVGKEAIERNACCKPRSWNVKECGAKRQNVSSGTQGRESTAERTVSQRFGDVIAVST